MYSLSFGNRSISKVDGFELNENPFVALSVAIPLMILCRNPYAVTPTCFKSSCPISAKISSVICSRSKSSLRCSNFSFARNDEMSEQLICATLSSSTSSAFDSAPWIGLKHDRALKQGIVIGKSTVLPEGSVIVSTVAVAGAGDGTYVDAAKLNGWRANMASCSSDLTSSAVDRSKHVCPSWFFRNGLAPCESKSAQICVLPFWAASWRGV